MKHIYQEPSLAHIDRKIFAWIIACVFVGCVLSELLPSHNQEDDKYLRQQQRTIRTQLRMIRGGRPTAARRKTA